MAKIVLELEPEEAYMLLDPIQAASLTELALAAKTNGDRREYAEIRANVYQRTATRLVDQLIPNSWDEVRDQDRRDEAEWGLA